MFRFFIFINLILVHVFCQTTEDNLQFNTDSPTTESWQQDTSYDTTQSWDQLTTEQPLELSTESWNEVTTEQSLELGTNYDTTQSQEQITTEEPLELNNESDTTQTWQEFTTEETSEEENFNTTQQITSTVPTMSNATFPSSITCDMLEEIKKEILDVVLLNISREMNSKLEALEVLLSALNCSNNKTSSAIELSWQIYENLQISLTGWLLVFDQPYSHKTRIDDLNQIAGICHNEVLIGATYNGSIILAAVGPASVLTINTPWNQPQQFGEVYWYRTNGLSFGFSPNSIIRQTSADNQDLDSSVRLSWLLDQNMGGYRAGVARSLANNSFWHKVIYCN